MFPGVPSDLLAPVLSHNYLDEPLYSTHYALSGPAYPLYQQPLQELSTYLNLYVCYVCKKEYLQFR